MIHKKHHSWRGGLGWLRAAGAVALLLLPALGTAATRTVTTLADATNPNDGVLSLREAIGASVNGDTINFSVAGTITLTSGELLIGRSIAINGPTLTSLTVSGNNASRVFNIPSGISVNISSLTISSGYENTGGGGLLNNGTLTINNCAFSGNRANYGGGIFNNGTLTVNNSTFSGNTASPSGGGIDNYNGRTLTVNNSTFSGNTASSYGGGIFNEGVLNILNTISANNTGGPSGPDIASSFAVISQGHNLIGKADGSRGWVGSDLLGTTVSPLNPHLGPLQNNGGPTFTMALLPISAAIDAGDDAVLDPPYGLSTDQRGRARRTGDHVDIGAYEYGGITRLVTTLTDSVVGSLRGALSLAMDSDRILFAPVVRGTIRLTNGVLLINRPLTIIGPGASVLAISGNTNSRVFQVTGGPTVISGLTIADGYSERGSGIQNGNGATLTVDDCTFSGNTAIRDSSFVNFGAGLVQFGFGQLNVNRCTFVDNTAALGGAGLGNMGGTVVVNNSTFTRNSALYAGAIVSYNYNSPSSTLTLRSSTVVGNHAMGSDGQGGGLRVFSGTFNITGTIVAGNTTAFTAPDLAGMVTSAGWNLIGITDGSSGWTTNDFLGNSSFPLSALLGPCQDNGGPVWTMGPLAGSPARDAGNSGLPTDARGGPRIVDFPNVPNAPGGDGSDIGALEVDSLFGAITITKSATSARVRFKSDPGTTYRLQQTSVVTNRVWTNIVGTVMMGNGQNLEATDFGPLPTARFYRVRAD